MVVVVVHSLVWTYPFFDKVLIMFLTSTASNFIIRPWANRGLSWYLRDNDSMIMRPYLTQGFPLIGGDTGTRDIEGTTCMA